MPRLRRSKSSGDISAVSTPTFPLELVRKFASRKQPKALAVSSASIALSIGSAFHDTNPKPSDRATSQRGDAGWQTAYAAARMAVEIAKESSDAFPPLKAVVGAISALMRNFDQTIDNSEDVKDIERRTHSLSSVLGSPVREDDYAEKARRLELQRKLERVIAKLEPLSEQHKLLGFIRNVDDAKILNGFVRELADAITDYQVSIQQGMYEKTGDIHEETRDVHDATKIICEDTRNILDDTKCIQDDTKNILEVSQLEVLDKLEPVRNAGYQGGHHDKCLPGTRESVLHDISVWATTPQDQNVFWLNGLAGTGKSTIAQSISETLANDGVLGASFFCSRDFLDRRVLRNIFPTLAYQLACRYPLFRNSVIKVIKKDPTIAHASLISQLEELLVKPLSEANVSCVIVIDALDECIDDQPASAILSVLGRLVKKLPLVKFFITGRPEPRIRTGFRLPLLEPMTQIFLLHEVKLTHVDKDIRLYLTQRLAAIAKRRSDVNLPNPWPSDGEIVSLTKKSSGLFIFASTIARFIESDHHEPKERMQRILSKTSGTTYEGRAGIDSLYAEILLQAFSDVRESEVFVDIKRVLGAIILAFNPLSRKELSIILGIPSSLISTTLRHLHSVILVPSDETEKIRVFHKSFPDFLQDRNRCTDVKFHINPMTHHSGMVLNCLELVKKLKVNPCGLPPFTRNQDVRDLPQLLENKLGGAVRYACGYWARHLKLSRSPDIRPIINSITKILNNGTPWIEVMSLENRLEDVIYSMYDLLDWLDDMLSGEELYSLATDYLRLTTYFFHPIQQCAQQIYHTALPLSPVSSQLHSVHQRRVADDRICRVDAFLGAPRKWGLLLTTIDVRPTQLTCITTFAQRIVVASEDIVKIYNAITFILEQCLRAPHPITKIQDSGDGSILYLAHSHSVTSWDIQTGGFIDTFTTRSEINDMVVSPTGGHIACGLSDDSVVFWDIQTKEENGFGNSQPLVTIRWLSPTELVVATQSTVHIVDTPTGETSDDFRLSGIVWGMVILSGSEFLVGCLGRNAGEVWTISYCKQPPREEHAAWTWVGQSPRHHTVVPVRGLYPAALGQPVACPMGGNNQIVCITPPRGIQVFGTSTVSTRSPSILNVAKSVAVSLRRNLVVQTEDSVLIFSVEVLTSEDTQDDAHPSQIYPLGEKHVVCLQPNRQLTVLELKTLRELLPSSLGSSLANRLAHASYGRGLVAEFGAPVVMRAWQTGAPLPRWAPAAEEDALLGGLSPNCTQIATVYDLPQREIRVKDVTDGTVLANLPLEDGIGTGVIYDLTFDSETRFFLSVDGPECNFRIPYNIIASPSGQYSHTIAKGEPMPLPKSRATSPYTLDANCEWVIDPQSRRICWIPPDTIRRGNGGHYWTGLSLVMLGEDGVVRKLTFKAPGR